jgi:hypothetical protein
VPVLTDAFVTTTSESDCNLVNSKFAGEPGENTDTSVPVEVVSLIPVMGRVKLRMVVFAGGVSEMEMLSEALPLPPPPVLPFFTPLQAEIDRTPASTPKTRYFLEFMQTPHDGFHRHHLAAKGSWNSPPTLYPSPHHRTHGKPGIAQILTSAGVPMSRIGMCYR